MFDFTISCFVLMVLSLTCFFVGVGQGIEPLAMWGAWFMLPSVLGFLNGLLGMQSPRG